MSPKVLGTSPPCASFSSLQNINQRHYTDATRTIGDVQAMSLLDFAVPCCRWQHRSGRGFRFEHTWKATSWQREPPQALATWDGVGAVDFDQCTMDVVGPNGQPTKKRTELLTHIRGVLSRFSDLQCSCTTEHLCIEGSCLSISLSRYCQVYTPFLVTRSWRAPKIISTAMTWMPRLSWLRQSNGCDGSPRH